MARKLEADEFYQIVNEVTMQGIKQHRIRMKRLPDGMAIPFELWRKQQSVKEKDLGSNAPQRSSVGSADGVARAGGAVHGGHDAPDRPRRGDPER